MRASALLLTSSLLILPAGMACAQNNTPHNLVLFIPDGLRALKVSPETAPAMAEIRDKGMELVNVHRDFADAWNDTFE